MKYGVDRELESQADAFLRERGEEPTQLRPWRDELRVAKEAAIAQRRRECR